jgi:hypothetical protein
MQANREDRIIDTIFWLFGPRGLSTVLFFFIASLMLDVPGKKIALLCLLVFGVHKSRIGQRRLEQLSFFFLVAATIVWLQILPSREWLLQAKSEIATVQKTQ